MSQHNSTSEFDPTQNRGSDLTEIFKAINSSNIGPNRPSYVVEGTIWLKKLTSPDSAEMCLYDGHSDIPLGTFNFSTHKFTLHSTAMENFGSAAFLDAGTSANELVKLDGFGRLPALDARNLTNLDLAGSSFPIAEQQRVALLPHSSQGGGGYRSGVVALADGSLRCWGNGSHSQLGQGSADQHIRKSPRLVHRVWRAGGIKKIIAEGYNKWVLMDTGWLFVWGRNNHGELGQGSTAAVPLAQEISIPSGSGTVVDIAAGSSNTADGYHLLILTSTGKIFSTGNNQAGQIGDGTTTSRSSIVEVGSGTTWAKIFAFGSGARGFSAAITTGGDLYVWGWNGTGNLGLGDTTNRSSPTLNNLFGGADVDSMSATEGHQFNTPGVNGAHSAFLLVDGRVYTAGDNRNGQLGTGNLTQYTVPQEITSLGSDNIQVLAAGGSPHGVTYVRKSNPTHGVYATGWNGYGGLGVGDTTSRNVFTLVIGSTINQGVAEMHVIGNDQHLGFVVRHVNGYVYSTGYNGYGSLGLGDNVDKTSLSWVSVSLNQFLPVALCVVGNSYEAAFGVLTENGQYLQTGYGGNGQNGDEDQQNVCVPRLFTF